jgi:molybdopterin synthase sulfur carrier subunit
MSGGASTVEVPAGALSDVIKASTPPTPASRTACSTTTGNLRKFVNVFVDDDDVRYLDGLATEVPDGQSVSIIPAVAGG